MNNDLISREALKEELSKRLWFVSSPQVEAQTIKDIIDNAPTVTPTFGLFKEMLCSECEKRPQGEWVVQRLQSGFDDVYCPYCNARPTRSEYGYYLRDNFCHECGADMRKGGAE